MATHDYIISNASGAAVRSDLNNALAAIVSNNSSATEPTTTYAYMWWADTTAGQLKIRNSTDTDWVVINELDGTSLMEDGTVSAPGLAFADDLNTGFYRPGTDELGIATGGVNAITVDSSQRVGIGTTTPSTPGGTNADNPLNGQVVSVYGSSPALDLVASSATGYSLINFGRDGATTNPYRFVVGYDQANDLGVLAARSQIVFKTDSALDGVNERVRIDSSGRLLVGATTAPGSAGSAPYGMVQLQGNTYSSTGPGVITLRSGTAAASVGSGGEVGQIAFAGSDNEEFALINCEADAATGSGDHPGRLVFKTTADGASSPTERMRITSAGFTKHTSTGTFVGASGSYHSFRSGAYANAALYVDHTSTSPYGIFLKFSGASPDNNTNWFISGDDFTFNRFRVYSDGDVVTSDQGTLTSDATLKRDITDATPKLADVMNLQVRNYYWKEDYHPHKQNKLIGFIAQEFEEVFPGLVTEHEIKQGDPILDEEGNDTGEKTPGVYKKCIREGKLIPILVKALQEAVERIETLEAKVAALESA